MIHKEFIFTELEGSSKEQIITQLADRLLAAGYVKDTYRNAVLDREKEYPTGLSLGEYCIAIPHTFAAHVNQPAIAVAKLKNPVSFVEMGSADTALDVSLVMMMAISNPEEQVGLLKKILRLFSDEDILKTLMESSTSSELYELLRHIDEP
ncbi:PTS sugar transporter subunit IIA [Extibacter muris]|uniref:PTS sugar transporter subunit IIA n=1 Tax=Extibacter muris TaxID=1796622 RepID=UPI001D07A17C|nr:PTS sugar transporter subunit IIA [Extibacter muris]MCB6203435.1 PTS sugar transporter subunit IIA [Extibacter muris]MCQ4665011.1 PTS sugar transporter subunit IIA [Extibacter muris]MCQ4694376.1 PTS sugar transporter subunit IIA [Extibacter muris]